ncbi:MAG: hypothetical protein M0P70_09465 [Desulfobulbaceae bacterium]|nr:hypothetical protein [Desulfobulbaceae bacterium]
MIRNLEYWLPAYLKSILQPEIKYKINKSQGKSILFTICDHFEPYWNNVDDQTAYSRVKNWLDHYQPVAASHKDSLGNHPKHCFYYPAEEYRKDLLDMVGEICRNGFGETEIHLHHDNDTSENLRNTLLSFKKILANDHGLLSVHQDTNEVKYGFIHGNWALDNSRPDGRCCGVNDELTILQETGCYADFTMPSAPSDTQTRTINSIYYAVDDPCQPKSHDIGKPAEAGKKHPGLLCIQGPLCLNMKSRKFGLLPRIENGCLSHDMSISAERVSLWAAQHIHVLNRPDIIFIKLHSHGSQEQTMDFFFKHGALDHLYSLLENYCCVNRSNSLYYVSSRQMYNVVKGLEERPDAPVGTLLDFELLLPY